MSNKKRFFKCKKCNYSLWISVNDKYKCQNCKMRNTLKKYNQRYGRDVYRTYAGVGFRKRKKLDELDSLERGE